jgi:hypothetical protein
MFLDVVERDLIKVHDGLHHAHLQRSVAAAW